jgi:hypothetical protein
MIYAILESNTIVNIVVADEPLDSNWIENDDYTLHIGATWDGTKFNSVQPPEPDLELIKQNNKNQASQLLSETDWSVQPDVTIGSPKLANQSEFISYRSQLRAVIANPTVNVEWPEVPTASWSS